MVLQRPQAPLSPEVIRHHVGLHARMHDIPIGEVPCSTLHCPHDEAHMLCCARCGDVLFLFRNPDATCDCDRHAAQWLAES